MSAVLNVVLSGKTHYGQMEPIILMVDMTVSMAAVEESSEEVRGNPCFSAENGRTGFLAGPYSFCRGPLRQEEHR